MNMGTVIRLFRQVNNISAKDLAIKIGQKRSYIDNVEINKIHPSNKVLCDIARSFNVTLDQITSIKTKAEANLLSEQEVKLEIVKLYVGA